MISSGLGYGSGGQPSQPNHGMAGAYKALLLPPYSPELNPVERWFEALRATLSNQLFATIDALDQALTQALQPYWEHTPRLVQLTRFTWWRKATDNIRTALTHD